MSISKGILGMNARNFLYVGPYNKGPAKRMADDKLATKKALIRKGIPTSPILHVFETRQSIKKFSWNLPKEGFAVKPARGYGGEGILVFDKWFGTHGITVSGKEYNIAQLKSHILDIFDGIYSLQSLPDKAYIEEKIIPHPFFKKYVPLGVSDIRVIVFNKIPIMSMLRLPTEKSGGKANIHQGAICLGIGMRTGITKYAITTRAIQGLKPVKFIPGTKIKTQGIKIPNWDDLLLLASRAQEASGLGYAGIDIVFDKNQGPLVIEINARPGLAIQIANLASLRTRLERIEDLKVSSPERGVEIAKSIFAEEFSHKVREEKKVLSVIEPVRIADGDGNWHEFNAKLDTGAYRTSIDTSLVTELGIPVLDQRFRVTSASGHQNRPAVKLRLDIGDKKITTVATVANRSAMRFPMIIGRRDLKGFFINPELASLPGKDEDSDLADYEE